MSALTLDFPGLTMEIVRAPYWLGYDQRTALAGSIEHLLDTCQVMPPLRTSLTAVLAELGVVAARDHVWPQSARIVRQITGYNDDVLPIRMSNDEHAAVLTLTTLTDSVRNALTGGETS